MGKSLNKEIIIAFIKKQETHQGGGRLFLELPHAGILSSHQQQQILQRIQRQETMAHSQEKEMIRNLDKDLACRLKEMRGRIQGQKTRGSQGNMINGGNCLKDPCENSGTKSKKTKISKFSEGFNTAFTYSKIYRRENQ